MKRVWTVVITLALVAAGCASNETDSDIFAASENIGDSEQANESAADDTPTATSTEGEQAEDASTLAIAEEEPAEVAAVVISDDLQGFLEQFFTARDSYFIEGQDPLIEQIASPAVLGLLDTERFENLNEQFETDVLTAQQSQPLNVSIEEVADERVVQTCVVQTVRASLEDFSRWVTAELTVSGDPGSFLVNSFEVTHDGTPLAGLGCVPDFAEERAEAVASEFGELTIELFEDPRSFDRASDLDALVSAELAASFVASIDGLVAQNIFQGDQVESQIRVLGSDPSFVGQTVQVVFCRRFPDGATTTDYDSGVEQPVPNLGPGSSVGTSFVVRLGEEPTEDRLIQELVSSASCWEEQ